MDYWARALCLLGNVVVFGGLHGRLTGQFPSSPGNPRRVMARNTKLLPPTAAGFSRLVTGLPVRAPGIGAVSACTRSRGPLPPQALQQVTARAVDHVKDSLHSHAQRVRATLRQNEDQD